MSVRDVYEYTDTEPSVVGSPGPQTVKATVLVLDADGNPVAGELVALDDRGGVPTTQSGRTDAAGQIVIYEGVGPAPPNHQTVRLPDRGLSADLGWHNGGAVLSHVFRLDIVVEQPTSSEPAETGGGVETVTTSGGSQGQSLTPTQTAVVVAIALAIAVAVAR